MKGKNHGKETKNTDRKKEIEIWFLNLKEPI